MASPKKYSGLFLIFITVRNSSCGKVMFSQACVKNSVHVGGGHAWQGVLCGRGECMAGGMHGGGTCVQGGMYGRGVHGSGGNVWQGVCMARGCAWQRGVHGRGHAWQGGMGHAWQEDMHGRRDGHCSGWYTSYWNAFLSDMKSKKCIKWESIDSVPCHD